MRNRRIFRRQCNSADIYNRCHYKYSGIIRVQGRFDIILSFPVNATLVRITRRRLYFFFFLRSNSVQMQWKRTPPDVWAIIIECSSRFNLLVVYYTGTYPEGIY